MYESSTCSGEPYALITVYGCLDTSTEDDFVMVSCEGDEDASGAAPGLDVATLSFQLGASAALSWGFLWSAHGFF